MQRLNETDNVICNHLECIVLWRRSALRLHIFLCDGVAQFVVVDMAFPVAHGFLLHVLGKGFCEVDAGLVGKAE